MRDALSTLSSLQDFRRKKNVAVAWPDLKNVFGSVPIDHLLRTWA